MKRIINLLLIASLLLSGCTRNNDTNKDNSPSTDNFSYEWKIEENVKNLDDELLLSYIEDTVYDELQQNLEIGYVITNVSTTYISKEYIEELSYNSKANVFFGYTIAELDAQFQGQKYYFTLGENGETVVKVFNDYKDGTYDQILKNVLVGSGVILVCVTVASLTATSAPAISMIFAASATTGSTMALQGAAYKGVADAFIKYAQTGELDEAFKAGLVGASEGFKGGAIFGALVGGGSEAIGLYGATTGGLTMNEVALIQKESGYPLDVIKGFANMDQYNICKNAGLTPEMINGKTALIRNIDLFYKDEFGVTNLERMKQGLAALDPATGEAYQLHHIGQKMDSTLAILTKEEHMLNGNNKIWHEFISESSINRQIFDKQREAFWKAMAEILSK